MDDALRGGTLYHLYCAKLIAGWGGKLGTNRDTDAGREFTAKYVPSPGNSAYTPFVSAGSCLYGVEHSWQSGLDER